MLKTWELVFPTRGDMMEAMYLESWHEGDPMHETMGPRGMDSLRINIFDFVTGVALKKLVQDLQKWLHKKARWDNHHIFNMRCRDEVLTSASLRINPPW